jgi:hypothetical protein
MKTQVGASGLSSEDNRQRDEVCAGATDELNYWRPGQGKFGEMN